MAEFHTLDRSGDTIDGVAHFLMPAGTNSSGTTWKVCYLASFGAGAPTSRLVSSGNNNPAPGKIGNQELTQIQSGDIVEISFQFPAMYAADGVTLDTNLTNAAMTEQGRRAIADKKTDFVRRFQFYGFAVGVPS